MPLPRQINPLLQMFQGPQSNNDVNDDIAATTAQYKATSPEMQREQAILANSDNRAEIGIRGDLEQAGQVRNARNMGFEGSLPLKEQKDEEERSALAKILMPKQMELEAAQRNQAATREFTAGEHDQDRELRAQIAAGQQAGQNSRQATAAGNAAARTVKVGSNPLRSIFGGHMGIDTNQQVQEAEQQRLRESVQGQMGGGGTPTGTAGMVEMIAPNGRPMSVPEDRVAEMEAHGAQRVQ